MKIGHIFITGLIGTSFNEDGSIKEKGVELLDVVEQMESLEGDEEAVHVHINSKGGYVTVGDSIAQLISGIPNVATIAEGFCASIATKIHLAAPLENRFIEEGCNYMIHNPFLANVSGDATKLKELSASIQQTENDLEKMYSQATGLDKKIISGLMAQETFLTDEQCITLKFASAPIIKKQLARAVALMYSKNENNNNMKHTNRAAAAMAVILGNATVTDQKINPLNGAARAAKAVMITTGDGVLETPFEDVMIGDPIVMDGEPASGSFEMSEGELLLISGETVGVGTVIVAVDGVITEITAAEVEEENNGGATGGEGEETLESLKAKLATAETDKATAEAALLTSEDEKEVIVKQMEQAAALGSKFKVPNSQNSFRQPTPENTPQGEFSKEDLAERRNSYKKK
jgi:ATP-dependent protease ClpP protease subunit